jgi:APA family basic amino acid/polyamine antiporter
VSVAANDFDFCRAQRLDSFRFARPLRDGTQRLFFRSVGKVHPQFHTPSAAIVLLAVVASLLLLSGQYKQLYTLVIFPSWILYGMTAASVIVLRYKRPDLERPYRVPGYPIVPALFVLVAIALLYSTLQESPGNPGLAWSSFLQDYPFIITGKVAANLETTTSFDTPRFLPIRRTKRECVLITEQEY